MDNNHLPPAHPVFTEDHFETTSAQTEITRWPHHFLVKKPTLILQGLKARSDAASKVRRNPQALARGSVEGMPSSELLPSTPQPHPQLLESRDRWKYLQKHLLPCQSYQLNSV